MTLTNFSSNWVVWFQVIYPNKNMKISYADIESNIYKFEPLSAMQLPPFDHMVVQASFATVDSYVNGWATSNINAERASGAANFQVRLALIHCRRWRWPLSRATPTHYCQSPWRQHITSARWVTLLFKVKAGLRSCSNSSLL
ncbi:hypothetical protein ACJRO7_003512 [Eucalyptus globulus]|uniref:Uncharacterized protein n=1 Tax=Eucalyptus globulus TaxID=34317 RepID=A0ABD3IWL0_EUCGL